MNKRNIEYYTNSRDETLTIKEWLEKMAEDRWQLVAIAPNNYYIFKRHIIDEYFRNLQEELDRWRLIEGKYPSEHNNGVVWGLSMAYSMYTN